ncbi:HP1 family phage holin [Kosakonia cowanii]|uniref:HP1 family phage holin n=1 Tax=Kosakonia cowanii TaxID=208223 RepID=UPI0023F6E8D5|nr:HP1 family phage holin [Kosakonia cowanii]MDF7759672.1 HP1 family phage holin [Kosakonia cowanii]
MGVSIERFSSSLAYWISVALTFFGAMTPQDFAAYFGALGVAMTVGVNWYYRRKSYLFLKSCAVSQEVVNGLTR